MRPLLILALVACSDGVTRPTQPPPIAQGACIADVYSADLALTQSCTWLGYAWACSWSVTTETNTCKRVGEATGERGK